MIAETTPQEKRAWRYHPHCLGQKSTDGTCENSKREKECLLHAHTQTHTHALHACPSSVPRDLLLPLLPFPLPVPSSASSLFVLALHARRRRWRRHPRCRVQVTVERPVNGTVAQTPQRLPQRRDRAAGCGAAIQAHAGGGRHEQVDSI
jgi:hypothetical protein